MKNKKNNKIMAFLLLLLVITVGYALLSQQLDINGTTNIKKTTWSIIWDNVVVNENSVKGDAVTQAAQITNTEKTLVEYSITLSEPGEFYEFTVDAKNEGTLDGMINTVSNKVYESNGTTEKTLPAYLTYSVTYSDGKAIAPKQLLKAGTTEKYKVRVEFKDVEASQLPAQEETIKFKFSVDYVQADETGEEVVHALTGTRYTTNIYDTTKPDNNVIRLNQTMPSHIAFHETESAAKSAFNNRPFYLKHTISNNIVTESYVGFVVTEAMAQANPGMTAGTYYLRGGVNESSLSEKPIYEANKATLLSAFGSSYCSDGSSRFSCDVSGFRAIARSNGGVTARDGDVAGCNVDNGGSSSCNEW